MCFFRYNLRVLDRRHSGWFSATFWLERGRKIEPEMYFHRSDGLRLLGVPLLCYDHLSRAINCSLLRPYIPSGRKAGQTLLTVNTRSYTRAICKHDNELMKIT